MTSLFRTHYATALCIVLLLLWSIGSMSRFARQTYHILHSPYKSLSDGPLSMRDVYPDPNDRTPSPSSNPSLGSLSFVPDNKTIHKFQSEFVQTFQTEIPFLEPLCQAANKVESSLNLSLVPPSLKTISFYPDDRIVENYPHRDQTKNIMALSDFSSWCSSNQQTFCVIFFPAHYSPQHPANGILDFCNQNIDEVSAGLTQQGIPVFDLRTFLTHEVSFFPHFYKTDHHWTINAALWAAEKTLNYLRTQHEIPCDDVPFSEFKSILYPKSYLGSWGRLVTLAKTSIEDFEILLPSFETDLSCHFFRVNQFNFSRRGLFETALLHHEHEPFPGRSVYSYSPYDIYLGGLCLAEIQNHKSTNQTKILLISDSMSNAYASFLSLGVSRLTRLSPNVFDGCLKTYIEKTGPYDIILFAIHSPKYSGRIFPWLR